MKRQSQIQYGDRMGRRGRPLRASVPHHLEITDFLPENRVPAHLYDERPQAFGAGPSTPEPPLTPHQAARGSLGLFMSSPTSLIGFHIQPQRNSYESNCQLCPCPLPPPPSCYSSAFLPVSERPAAWPHLAAGLGAWWWVMCLRGDTGK